MAALEAAAAYGVVGLLVRKRMLTLYAQMRGSL